MPIERISTIHNVQWRTLVQRGDLAKELASIHELPRKKGSSRKLGCRHTVSRRYAPSRGRPRVYCTGRHGIFVTHPGRVSAPRLRVFIFRPWNPASATPFTCFADSSPVSALTVQATPSRATCFFVRSKRTSFARCSATNGCICALPLYGPPSKNG